nr:MAG TPA: hypothetical protein [Caudoviricetes sp.]
MLAFIKQSTLSYLPSVNLKSVTPLSFRKDSNKPLPSSSVLVKLS